MPDGTFSKKLKTILAADFWCGGGGTSTGLREAAKQLGLKLELTAVNHWEVAVATHSKNHPEARHFCKAVDSLSPLELFPGRRIKLLVASPECVHHSRARGGKPRDEQRRADAWDIQRWVEKLFIENLIIENVQEFVDWGPLDGKGHPIKSKKGVYFKRFVDYLEELYTVEWRIVNCADYGDATTRKRFFLLAKRGKNKRIVFPAPSHASRKVLDKGQGNLFNPNDLKPWVAAREIINWELEGKNIFGRKKPLSDNTMKRIYAGLRTFSGIDIPERQFSDDPVKQKELDIIYQTSPIRIDFSKFNSFTMGTGGPTGQQRPRSADEPLRTILTDPRQNVFTPKLEAFLFNQKATDRQMRSIHEPAFTQCGKNHQYVCQPYMVNLKGTTRRMRGIDEPTFTQTTVTNQQMLIQPSLESFVIKYHGNHKGKTDGNKRSNSLDEPLKTLDTSNRFGLVEACLVPCNHGKGDVRAYSIDDPMKTITGVDALGIAIPGLLKYHGNENGAHSIDEPLSTVTTKDRCGLFEPFMVQYFGGLTAVSVDKPMPTITANYEHYALAQPFMIQFYGERDGQNPRIRDLDTPVWTVTPQIRMGIVEPFLVKLEDAKGKVIHGLLLLELGAILVVNFRMLHQTELAAAMSFPKDYYFHGTRDQQVKQIGNAVPCRTAEALCKAILGGK